MKLLKIRDIEQLVIEKSFVKEQFWIQDDTVCSYGTMKEERKKIHFRKAELDGHQILTDGLYFILSDHNLRNAVRMFLKNGFLAYGEKFQNEVPRNTRYQWVEGNKYTLVYDPH